MAMSAWPSGVLHLAAQQHGELVAAQPRHHVLTAHGGAEPPGHGGEQGVAGGVAVAVVDGLEAVEVEVEQRRAGAGRLALGALVQRLQQAHPEGAAVEQPGQRVAGGLLGQAAAHVGVVGQGHHLAHRGEQHQADHRSQHHPVGVPHGVALVRGDAAGEHHQAERQEAGQARLLVADAGGTRILQRREQRGQAAQGDQQEAVGPHGVER
jgi:hypothetical protein